MNDFARIAQIIHFLDEQHTEQPDLAEVAARANLSPFHLHRLFSRWAGITPKDFLQYATLSHARALLQQGESVLDTALATGLSGPGRLHDLCVTLEAASPGELKSGGEGWLIQYGFVESPFGQCLIAESPRGICQLAFADNRGEALAELRTKWPEATLKPSPAIAKAVAGQIFAPSANPRKGASAPLRAFVRGTAFQVRVWRALLEIDPGSVTTYSRLAAMIDRPAASRAVGTAVGQNPLAYLIPCHRVIRETGALGGYHWGLERKRAMIAWEGARQNESFDRK